MTRRGVLKTGIGGAIWIRAKAEAAETVGAPMAALSEYMAAAAARELPEPVTARTKEVILDTLAAMISGSELPPGRFAIRFARSYGGEKASTVVASEIACGPIEAALANGILAHSDETDDTHPPSQSHPGSSVVPSALAVGEKFGIDGTRMLRAVALGYDVGPRVTETLGRIAFMTKTHLSTHAISGTFGSAAAASCAAGLNAQQMRWMLSYTAQQASGLASWQRDTEHIEKAFDFAGMPARNGVTSALLVAAGGTGLNDVFSGADNFFEAFVPLSGAGTLTEQLGERYEVMRTNFKKWTVGSPIQAPLDALESLLRKYHLRADDVKSVTARVAEHEAAIVNNRDIPDICLQHMLAVMLVDGTVSFKSAHDQERMKDPAVLKQRAKIQLIADAELERLLPRREAVVEVETRDGRKFSERVGNVRGTVENPMSRQEIEDKARDLIAPVFGSDRCAKLIQAVFHLEAVRNIGELRPLLQRT
jgi:2-methylcitrate dehydratase PrpD